MRTNPRVRLSPSVLNRVTLVDARLRQAGLRVFFYSPKHVTPTAESVPGYVLEHDHFVRTRAEIPAVNGNWTYETRRLMDKGMGYQEYVRWTEERRIGIYVPHAFSELVRNKLETYKLVRTYHESLHPHCEPYRPSRRQLGYFTEHGRLTFIKPRAGSKGNRIVTLRRDAKGLSVTYYEDGARKRIVARTLAEADEFISSLTRGGQRYVIQQGVETLPYDGSVFDIRVVMVHDGRAWQWVHEARLSPKGSDLSNVSQGGVSLVTEDLLFDLLGYEAAHEMLHELRSESFGLAAYLERLHPGDLIEVAFDFVIDLEGRLRLVEINTKPGLAGIGFLRRVHDKRPAEEPLFERWVYPHTTSLASFLQTKIEQLGT